MKTTSSIESWNGLLPVSPSFSHHIVFLELSGGQLSSKRDRKVHGPIFEVGRFLGTGFAMELKPDRLYPEG